MVALQWEKRSTFQPIRAVLAIITTIATPKIVRAIPINTFNPTPIGASLMSTSCVPMMNDVVDVEVAFHDTVGIEVTFHVERVMANAGLIEGCPKAIEVVKNLVLTSMVATGDIRLLLAIFAADGITMDDVVLVVMETVDDVEIKVLVVRVNISTAIIDADACVLVVDVSTAIVDADVDVDVLVDVRTLCVKLEDAVRDVLRVLVVETNVRVAVWDTDVVCVAVWDTDVVCVAVWEKDVALVVSELRLDEDNVNDAVVLDVNVPVTSVIDAVILRVLVEVLVE